MRLVDGWIAAEELICSRAVSTENVAPCTRRWRASRVGKGTGRTDRTDGTDIVAGKSGSLTDVVSDAESAAAATVAGVVSGNVAVGFVPIPVIRPGADCNAAGIGFAGFEFCIGATEVDRVWAMAVVGEDVEGGVLTAIGLLKNSPLSIAGCAICR